MELSRNELESLSDDERQSVLEELAAELSVRVLSASDFDSEVEKIISELRVRDHDLVLKPYLPRS